MGQKHEENSGGSSASSVLCDSEGPGDAVMQGLTINFQQTRGVQGCLALFLQQQLNTASLLEKIVGATGGSDLLRAPVVPIKEEAAGQSSAGDSNAQDGPAGPNIPRNQQVKN